MTSEDPGQDQQHRPPRDCPVCGAVLRLTRLGCGSCGSELAGVFEPCSYCGLTDAERDLLRVFLVSRGNMRELERHLGVSYPTARQRYADVLTKLGLEPAGRADPQDSSASGLARSGGQRSDESVASGADRVRILTRLAQGELDVESATHLLRSTD